MAPSEAHSAATGSPASRIDSSWRRIIAVSSPRRRCVGRTATAVTAPTPTLAPGTVRVRVKRLDVATIRPSSNQASERSGSWIFR